MGDWGEEQRYMGVWAPHTEAIDEVLFRQEEAERSKFAQSSSSDLSYDFRGLFAEWAEKADERLARAEALPKSEYRADVGGNILRIWLHKNARNLNAMDLFPDDPSVRALAASGRVLFLHPKSRTAILLDTTTGVWDRRAY